LAGANLRGAKMAGIDLSHADVNTAQLESADLPYAQLTGADFASARLDKANLTGGVVALNTSFLGAFLRGADFTGGAQLQGADFSSAEMQAAFLPHAHLEGAALRNVNFEAATLSQTFLQRADLSGAVLAGADLRGAVIWDTLPPATPPPQLADFNELRIEPLNEEQLSVLNATLGRVENDGDRQAIMDAIGPLLAGEKSAQWESDYQPAWLTLAASPQPVNPESYKAEITEYLAKLMCRARWSGGAVATGVAHRALASQFRGDFVAIYDSLRAAACPAANSVAPGVMKELAEKVNIARE
jgi:hypothetical protein